LSVDDLASFRAHLRQPLAIPYRGGTVSATPELTAGPTMAHTLPSCSNLQPARADRMIGYAAYASALRPIANPGRWATPMAAARSASKRWRRHHAFLRGRSRQQHGGVTQTLLSTFGPDM
jgi:gamma-glutamyltranspeptidase/glutathione hydrolase